MERSLWASPFTRHRGVLNTTLWLTDRAWRKTVIYWKLRLWFHSRFDGSQKQFTLHTKCRDLAWQKHLSEWARWGKKHGPPNSPTGCQHAESWARSTTTKVKVEPGLLICVQWWMFTTDSLGNLRVNSVISWVLVFPVPSIFLSVHISQNYRKYNPTWTLDITKRGFLLPKVEKLNIVNEQSVVRLVESVKWYTWV